MLSMRWGDSFSRWSARVTMVRAMSRSRNKFEAEADGSTCRKHLEKQIRRGEDAFAHGWRGVAPGGGHPHQILHGHVRGDLACAHLLPHAAGKQLHQRQPPRHPTGAAIEMGTR